MQNNYLEFLKSKSKKFAKQHELMDIILFGSSVRGKIEPKDIDIILISHEKNIKKNLEVLQEFRNILKNKISKEDTKIINIEELFESNLLARQGILIEGISLVYDRPLSNIMGFAGYSLFSYKLKNLNNTEKTKFIYSLIGRNKKGIIKKLKGVQIGKGAVMIPIENSEVFKEFLEKWEIKYNMRKILVSEF